jgi:eukaryotic-like serine/threonine-protein kinase
MSRLEDFAAIVARSGLVAPDALQRALSAVPSNARADAHVQLASILIRSGAVTSYQARKLLAGATRGFFLGGYRILRRLGEGGMGKVYLAQPEGGGEPVAIKVLPPQKAASEEQALKRFRREMDLSQRVKHPNLAETLDVGRDGDVHYMILEYVRGLSLYQMIRGQAGGPFRVPDAARFFVQVLDGLDAAHRVGLIHRDIKPSNLMVTPEGNAKILDLGLARLLGEEGALTRPNVVIGTLDYASPEQLGDAARADQRSDLYSVGCTLYFTLVGHPPFEGGDVVNKIFKQRMDDPEPLERVVRGVPSAFATIVRKLMNKVPDDRYQSCHELQADLAKWTDPNVVRAILGAASESAREFRPPPPDLEDADLRWIDGEVASGEMTVPPGARSLRDLGAAEPQAARMRKPPAPPKRAVVVPDDSFVLPAGPRSARTEAQRLAHFIAIALALGVLAIILIVVLHSFAS